MWLPDEDIYLERGDPPVRTNRPFLQGDVFIDVPMALIKRFKESRDTTGTESDVIVALLGHPCAAYSEGRLNFLQTVAQVREMSGATGEKPFEHPWESHLHLFPLPGLLGGKEYVVDFRRIGTTHAEYLQGRRIACLSHVAWAAFQRRYVRHAVRATLDPDQWLQATALYWHEFEVWEEWNSRGFTRQEYQSWLEAPMSNGPYAGTIRRDALEYAPDEVVADFPESDP